MVVVGGPGGGNNNMSFHQRRFQFGSYCLFVASCKFKVAQGSEAAPTFSFFLPVWPDAENV